ncbi:hypothetical protein QQF64_001126 [Cirrhinus molitorella]|uniref:Uncharacterized protein n=1 Tax=Cirrhinus molitorella TaxID=172907 RepID=A0ABR3P038_9TELE
MDIEFSKLKDGKKDLFIWKWEGTIIPKLKEIASLKKKNDFRHLLEKADNQQDDELCYMPMLKILIHLLPPTASGRSVAGSRCCVNSAVSYLLESKFLLC